MLPRGDGPNDLCWWPWSCGHPSLLPWEWMRMGWRWGRARDEEGMGKDGEGMRNVGWLQENHSSPRPPLNMLIQ